MVGPIFRAYQTQFLRAVKLDHVVVIRVLALGIITHDFQQQGRPRAIVVGPIVNGRRSFVQAVLTAHAQVVIVRTEYDGFAFIIVDVPDDIVAVAKTL